MQGYSYPARIILVSVGYSQDKISEEMFNRKEEDFKMKSAFGGKIKIYENTDLRNKRGKNVNYGLCANSK